MVEDGRLPTTACKPCQPVPSPCGGPGQGRQGAQGPVCLRHDVPGVAKLPVVGGVWWSGASSSQRNRCDKRALKPPVSTVLSPEWSVCSDQSVQATVFSWRSLWTQIKSALAEVGLLGSHSPGWDLGLHLPCSVPVAWPKATQPGRDRLPVLGQLTR